MLFYFSSFKTEEDYTRNDIHLATKNGDFCRVKKLLKKGVPVDSLDDLNNTPLHIAVFRSKVDIVRLLLSKGANVELQNKQTERPLDLACRGGTEEIVSMLLSRGARVNYQTRDGITCLHEAAAGANAAVVEMLLDKGAVIDIKDKRGISPFFRSCINFHVRVAEILLKRGANVNQVGGQGWSALMVACYNGDINLINLLLKYGADIHHQNSSGYTALNVGAQFGGCEVMNILLNKGADINFPNLEGWTPLHIACWVGRAEAVTFLLNRKANVDARDFENETPLHKALTCWHVTSESLINTLIANGATLDVRNNKGKTPYDLLYESNNSVEESFNNLSIKSHKRNSLSKHILKLKYAGISVDVEVKEDFFEEEVKSMKVHCLRELKKMKCNLIYENFTLYTVFTNRFKPFYLANQELLDLLQKYLQSFELEKDFPLYCDLLRNIFQKSLTRFHLLSETYDLVFSGKIPICSKLLPELKQRILTFLNNDELRELIAVHSLSQN